MDAAEKDLESTFVRALSLARNNKEVCSWYNKFSQIHDNCNRGTLYRGEL